MEKIIHENEKGFQLSVIFIFKAPETRCSTNVVVIVKR